MVHLLNPYRYASGGGGSAAESAIAAFEAEWAPAYVFDAHLVDDAGFTDGQAITGITNRGDAGGTWAEATNKPIYVASNAAFNDLPTVQFDGVNDKLQSSATTTVTSATSPLSHIWFMIAAWHDTLPGTTVALFGSDDTNNTTNTRVYQEGAGSNVVCNESLDFFSFRAKITALDTPFGYAMQTGATSTNAKFWNAGNATFASPTSSGSTGRADATGGLILAQLHSGLNPAPLDLAYFAYGHTVMTADILTAWDAVLVEYGLS